jgi:nicotinamide-nucleotide amidase
MQSSGEMDPALELRNLLLSAPRQTLAVAESLTAGHLQARVSAIPGASDYFLGGITAYTLAQKVRHLGVDRAHAESVNCVSPRVAAEMARGACALFGADLALATTGYAEPSPAENVPAPMACWALAHVLANGVVVVQSGRVEFPGASRTVAQERVAEAALAGLVAYLRQWRKKKPTAA